MSTPVQSPDERFLKGELASSKHWRQKEDGQKDVPESPRHTVLCLSHFPGLLSALLSLIFSIALITPFSGMYLFHYDFFPHIGCAQNKRNFFPLLYLKYLIQFRHTQLAQNRWTINIWRKKKFKSVFLKINLLKLPPTPPSSTK